MVDLRQRWSEGQPCHGLWSTLPGAVTGEVLARSGADFVVVDLQHGTASEADLPGVAAAITAAGSVPLVRTRSPSFADVGRPLDHGACGVDLPRDDEPASRSAEQGRRSASCPGHTRSRWSAAGKAARDVSGGPCACRSSP